MNQVYLTPAGSAISEITEKKSRFIAYITHVETVPEAEEEIKKVKKKYYNAKHNVFAYITENTKKYSDDGEPSKTAGLPILEMLDSEKITNVVCVVTRYFGGILLGTGGLVRAYTLAAKNALQNAGIVKLTLHCSYIITVSYSLLDSANYIIKQCGGIIAEQSYTDTVNVKVFCSIEKSEKLLRVLKEAFGVHIVITDIGTCYQEERENE